MERKWFHIHKIFKGLEYINVIPGYKKTSGGDVLNMCLTEEEANIIRNIRFEHIYYKRSAYLNMEHMMHEIYKVLPELFEY